MAKKKTKKSPRNKAKPARKRPAPKGAKKKAKRKSSAKNKAAKGKKSAVKAANKVAEKRKKKKKRTTQASLGRAKVTADEKLYMLFKEDYQARQIFAFLRVETVRELEEYGPHEIVKLLSKPIRQSVDGIRRLLAKNNRHLLDDKEFALEYRAKQQEK